MEPRFWPASATMFVCATARPEQLSGSIPIRYDEPASEKTVTSFVVAMDKNIQRSVQDVQAGLEEYFRANPVQ